MNERPSMLIVESDGDCLRAVVDIIASKDLHLTIDGMTNIHQALIFLHRLRHDVLLCDLPGNSQERQSIINDIFDTEKAPVAIFTTADTSFTRDTVPPSFRERVQAVIHKPVDMKDMFFALDAALSASSKGDAKS